MAVEIAHDPAARVAIMWDNTVDFAFGPVFSGPGADVEVQEFLDWLRESGPVDGAERTGAAVLFMRLTMHPLQILLQVRQLLGRDHF